MQQGVCDTPGCGNPLAVGTHLCWSHASIVVDIAVLRTPLRTAIEQNLNRRVNCDIRTPDEAARWLADERTSILGITKQEIRFYDQLRARRGVFSTDVETVGPLLIQAAIIDADRNVVVGGYIHHDCETVKEVWDLAVKVCGGPLTTVQSAALRKAFGSPSMKKPRGYSMHWLVDQLKTLKKEYPDICMAEWAAHPFDQVVYRNNIKRAGYNPADILPPPENWVSPMGWFRQAGPSLPGHQLAYVACLYHPSSLVFGWHDAIVDALMLMDILSTRQQKYHHGKVEVPPSSRSILLLFKQGPQKTTNGGNYLVQRPWLAREDKPCWVFMQDTLRKYEFASLSALCRAASYYLLQHKFFRTASSIKQHLTEKARRAKSEDEYVTCTDRQAQTLLLSTYNALTGPRSTSRRIAIPEPKIDPAAKLLVKQAYEETPHEGRIKSLFWSQCQKQVHALNKSNGSTFSEQELDLALLVMINSRIHIVCKGCGAAKPGAKCPQCEIRECVECGGVARGVSRCSTCFYQYYKDKERNGCMVCRRVCYGKICRSCERQVSGLNLLTCVEKGCNADRVGSLRSCASCFRKRRDQRKKPSQLCPLDNQAPIILNKGRCQDCGEERLAKDNATGVCRSCQQRASRLEALEVNETTVHCQTRAEDGEWTDGHEGVKKLSESSNQRQTPGEDQFKEKTEVLGDCQEPQERGGAEQIESQDSAKVSDDKFPLLVANESKRDRDGENSDAANTCKKQKTLNESEQSPEHCIEGCGNLKKGKSLRCTDCGRRWTNKRTNSWSQKKREEARVAKICKEESCTRPTEGWSPRCAECRQRRRREGKQRRNKKRTAEAQKSIETGVPLGECRRCKQPHHSEKGLCPPCLRAYKAQSRREKRREEGIETDCIEDGCDGEIMPGQARCAGCLERLKPICERCKGEGRPGLARCKTCQGDVDKEKQHRRDIKRKAREKQKDADQSTDLEDNAEEDDDGE
ncbi:hypothetical protein ACHAPJ_004316 [Fusarium lateritium]